MGAKLGHVRGQLEGVGVGGEWGCQAAVHTKAERWPQGQGKSSSGGRGTQGVVAGLRLRLRLRLAGYLYSIFIGRQAGLEPGSVAREARVDTSTP